ncbi:MAG: hypothetical protein DRJ33_00550 [Candidatus Methanomethylicota archaeon]|uniref:polynucleotide 5'-hydroxyl-kinase n=1 Tax=Thermoproteota archaeon TaxID=2056631 RepID=A0A497F400_9CREN|nr:MAG: hypothetical protein DRJ33_00550 [Candidatus Verstraetearchaeota archaeon]
MLVTLTQGKHLLIHGPASFTIQKGVVEILKALIHQSSKGFLVPKGRVLALKAIEDCLITVNIGEGGKVEEREKAFPEQWDQVIDELSRQKGTVVVIGDVDSGKTTFCTMLLNSALRKGLRAAFINEDPGQADILIPTTIGATILESPTIYLSQLKPIASFFIGKTTPTGVADRVILGLAKLRSEVIDEADLIVVNTSGWIKGEKAKELKLATVAVLEADRIVFLKKDSELNHILRGLQKSYHDDRKVYTIKALEGAKIRSREERRFLRESSYNKYFSEAKKRILNLDDLDISYGMLGSGQRLDEKDLATISMLLNSNVVYAEENYDSLLIVISKDSKLNKDAISNVRNAFGKSTVKVVKEGDERGLLIGLLSRGKLQGVGVLRKIDYVNRKIEIITPYEGEVTAIEFGCLRLNDEFKEVKQYVHVPI